MSIISQPAQLSGPTSLLSRSKILPKTGSNANSINPNALNDAVKVSIGHNEFLIKLEKHLDDYNRGLGYLSSQTAALVGEQALQTGLSIGDPKYAKLYNGYVTGLAYDKKARFVDGVNSLVKTLDKIGSGDPDELKKEIVEIYS